MSWMKNPSESRSQKELERIAAKVRLEILEMWARRRGPLSGQFSSVDIYVSLLVDVLNPKNYAQDSPDRLRFVPKGTGAFALYSAAGFAGLLERDQLQRFDREDFPPVPERRVLGDASPHKMGMSLEQGIGLALAGVYKKTFHPVIVFLSDGGLQPGVDHAAKFAARMNLFNLTVVIDVNGLQSNYRIDQVDQTLEMDESGRFRRQRMVFEGYGWDVCEIDGHDFLEIKNALRRTGNGSRPLLILARTVKGKGIECIEDSPDFSHELPEGISLTEAKRALLEPFANLELPSYPDRSFPLTPRTTADQPKIPEFGQLPGRLVADTLRVWVQQFISLNRSAVVINTDYPYPFRRDEEILSPEKHSPFVNAGINERFALNLAAGLATEGMFPIYIGPAAHMPVIAEDFKFLALDRQPVLVIGINPGSSTSHWGPAHLVYEDINAFNMPGAQVFQPATSWDFEVILNSIWESPQTYLPAYIRVNDVTSRADFSFYLNPENRSSAASNGFYVLTEFKSGSDLNGAFVALVSSGFAIEEVLECAAMLRLANIPFRIINVIRLSSVDSSALRNLLLDSDLIVSSIDARPESLANLLYTSAPDQRNKVLALGVSDGGQLAPPSEIFKTAQMDSQSIFTNIWDRLENLLVNSLENSIRWLLHSGIQKNDARKDIHGAFHECYDIAHQKYSSLCTETTGYGASFFVSHGNLSVSGGLALERALEAVRWITHSTQHDSGGVRAREPLGDNYNEESSFSAESQNLFTFETGICLKAILDVLAVTGDQGFLTAAESMGNFIGCSQRLDGSFCFAQNGRNGKFLNEGARWSRQIGPYQAKIASGLLDLADVTGNASVRSSAERVCEFARGCQRPDGRFPDESGPVTSLHLHCYAAEGLFDAGLRLYRDDFVDSSKRAIQWALSKQKSNGGIAERHSEETTVGSDCSDSLAQVLRLAARLLMRGRLDDQSFEKLEVIKRRLLMFQLAEGNQAGAFLFGLHPNEWRRPTAYPRSTIFAAEALAEYRQLCLARAGAYQKRDIFRSINSLPDDWWSRSP